MWEPWTSNFRFVSRKIVRRVVMSDDWLSALLPCLGKSSVGAAISQPACSTSGQATFRSVTKGKVWLGLKKSPLHPRVDDRAWIMIYADQNNSSPFFFFLSLILYFISFFTEWDRTRFNCLWSSLSPASSLINIDHPGGVRIFQSMPRFNGFVGRFWIGVWRNAKVSRLQEKQRFPSVQRMDVYY